MDDRQKQLVRRLLNGMNADDGADSRQALLRMAQAQMNDEERTKLQTLLHDPDAAGQLLRSEAAQKLMERLRQKDV